MKWLWARIASLWRADQRAIDCYFCGASEDEANALVRHRDIAICDQCIDTCQDVCQQKIEQQGKQC